MTQLSNDPQQSHALQTLPKNSNWISISCQQAFFHFLPTGQQAFLLMSYSEPRLLLDAAEYVLYVLLLCVHAVWVERARQLLPLLACHSTWRYLQVNNVMCNRGTWSRHIQFINNIEQYAWWSSQMHSACLLVLMTIPQYHAPQYEARGTLIVIKSESMDLRVRTCDWWQHGHLI